MLQLTEQLAQAVRVQQPQPAVPNPAQVPSLSLADEFLLRPEEATRKVADAAIAEKLGPAMQGMQGLATQFAGVQRMLAAQRFDVEFRKYGPEIDAMMANVPAEARTLENYEKVVTFIQGKYRNDPELYPAGRMMGVGERSGGGGGLPGQTSPTGVDFAKLPQGLGKVAERHGLTEAQVVEFCKATGDTPQGWMEKALNEKVITSVAPFSFQVKPEQVGVKRAFDA